MRSNVQIMCFLIAAVIFSPSRPSRAETRHDDSVVDGAYMDEVLEKIAGLIETKYVIPELGIRYAEEFRTKCRNGAYVSYKDPGRFAEQVSADLKVLTKDQHVHFRVIEPSDIGESTLSTLHHPLRYHRLGIKENDGFSKLERIEGNIGYFDVRRFYTFVDVRDKVIGAIKFLSKADAIIIDIRENGGGSEDYLSSYFLEHPTQLNSEYFREDDFLKEYWTMKDPGTERLTDVPLFILTSERTFSSAESFAYDMQARKRATLVGAPTRGGAHSVDLYKVDDRFEIYLSTARSINPVTGGNWEGTGVIPDIPVPSESALDTAIVLAREAGAAFAEGKEERLRAATVEMQPLMERVETLFREERNEVASMALDSLFTIAGRNGLVNDFFIFVLAYNYFAREDEQILYAILRKRIELFPESTDSYESLAYAYFRNDRRDPAIAAFEKVLEIDPENRNAMKMLKRLREE